MNFKQFFKQVKMREFKPQLKRGLWRGLSKLYNVFVILLLVAVLLQCRIWRLVPPEV